MKKIAVIIALLLVFSLSATAFAETCEVIETTHGTHAKLGATVYTYTEDGKTVSKTEIESISICPMTEFIDLPSDIWCHEGLDFVLSRGYMLGKTKTKFEPDACMTRAMVVTVLCRVANEFGMDTASSVLLPFSDTPKDAWYYNALRWAYKNSIAKGFNDTQFCPDGTVTREQITLFISRFAAYIGDEIDASGDVSKFSDVATLSAESKTAISWAVGHGILNGYDNSLIKPKNIATRAHFASMLQRWIDGRCTEHSYELTKSVKATCTEDGNQCYICSKCGAEKLVRTSASNHKYDLKEVLQEPTCTCGGIYKLICLDCGDCLDKPIPASGHSYGESMVGTPATCTKEGTYIKVCANCGDIVSVSTIPRAGHFYIDKISKTASCTENGTLVKTCSVCGNTITCSIPMLSHNYVDGKCTMCGKSLNTAIKTSDIDNGDRIIIYNPENKLCLGTTAKPLGLMGVPAAIDGINLSIEPGIAVLTVIKDGANYYFTDSNGEYLCSGLTDDGNILFFSNSSTDVTKWILDGSYIKAAGSPIYINCKNGGFTCYNMSSKTAGFAMELYKIS